MVFMKYPTCLDTTSSRSHGEWSGSSSGFIENLVFWGSRKWIRPSDMEPGPHCLTNLWESSPFGSTYMNALRMVPFSFHTSRCFAITLTSEVLPEPDAPTAYTWVAKSVGDITAASSSLEGTAAPHVLSQSKSSGLGLKNPSGAPAFADDLEGIVTPRVASRFGVSTGSGRCTSSGISERFSMRNGSGGRSRYPPSSPLSKYLPRAGPRSLSGSGSSLRAKISMRGRRSLLSVMRTSTFLGFFSSQKSWFFYGNLVRCSCPENMFSTGRDSISSKLRLISRSPLIMPRTLMMTWADCVLSVACFWRPA